MLHNITKNIYLKTLKLFGIQVFTNTGFHDIVSINKTERQKQYLVQTTKYSLKCSGNHILITADGQEIYAKDSLSAKIMTADGKCQTVTNVKELQDEDNLFDLSLSENSDHLYYADGMLSHNCVIADEFSFVPNNIASRVFESIYPVISSSKTSQFIIVSTPNGADPKNLYYSIWQQANQKIKDKNSEGWKAFRFDWWDVPGRDEQWKANTIASIGQRRFAQEFGNEFLSNLTNKKLIDDEIIEKYRMRLSEYKVRGFEPKVQRIVSENQNRIYEFKMWHAFDAKRTYMSSCDISEGVGGDSSVLYVWDVTDTRDVRMCAKFSSNRVSLTEFAYICSKILALYGNPFLFGERNGLSAGMLDSLRITYGYENIAAESKNGEAGIYSHVSVKLKSCLWCRDMLTTDGFGFTIYDKELLDEMGTFVKKDGKSDKTMYAAISPAHDDCIMSFVWACYALQPDVCSKYFIDVESFRSVFDQIYPRTLLPMTAYTSELMKKIQSDPLYADFVDWKEEAVRKNRTLEEQFRIEDEKDVFKYSEDPYFGGSGEAEWGSSWDFRPIQQGNGQAMNLNNRAPAYFV